MDELTIRSYANLMGELGLSALEVTTQGKHLRLEKNLTANTVFTEAPSAIPSPAETDTAKDPALVSIDSPMVGVFYTAAAQNQKSFVSVGDKVKKGDVLCIIESMKLMNEIISDYDGVVTEICVGNQQVVDYGHTLFRLRKEAV